jgi:hypothetical protein
MFAKIWKWIYIRLEYRLIKFIVKIVFTLKFTDEIIQSQREHLSNRVFKNYQGTIAFGLFKGLKLNAYTAWSGGKDTGAKILGLYESQILNWIGDKHFDLFIDIGAADGYYAMGLLVSGRTNSAITFETSNADRDVSQHLAIVNRVLDQIEIKGPATEPEIIAVLPQGRNGLILIDIEGGEFDLISENILESAKHYHFIIELHEIFNDRLRKEFIEMCSKSHFVEVIHGLNRNFPRDSFLMSLTDNERVLILSEGRQSGMEWLALSPRNPD